MKYIWKYCVLVIYLITSLGCHKSSSGSQELNTQGLTRNTEQAMAYPLPQKEVKGITLPFLEAMRKRDFKELAEYFQPVERAEITQEYGLRDYWLNKEDIQNVEMNSDLLDYFEKYISFDFEKALFINYGFVMSSEERWRRLESGDYAYENPMPNIMDQENMRWLRQKSAGTRIVVQLVLSRSIHYYVFMDKIEDSWYVVSLHKAMDAD